MAAEVMGIVNVTPDSFSDGGRYYAPAEAVRRAVRLAEEGAAILDFGGESTRPGATPLTWDAEWARLEPVFKTLPEALRARVRLSVDTYHPETAERALSFGVRILNCVYGEPIRDMFALAARFGAEVVCPATARGSVPNGLLASVPHYLDPMIGFGTTREEDLERLASIPALAREGRVLVGASRKRIVRRLTGEKLTGKNLGGNLALALWAVRAGASVVRVHDVLETVQALKVEAACSTSADRHRTSCRDG